MLLAIISDIHANVDALRAVLADIRARGADRVLCLGDLVGYNGFPRETLALLRDHEVRSVHGNHDLMALARLPDDGCGSVGRKAIRWTRGVLTEEDLWYLAGLPAELHDDDHDSLLCVHSAPGDALIRLERTEQFRIEAEGLMESDASVRVCFTGHTHRQHTVVVMPDGDVRRSGGVDAELPRDAVCFVNPGTVGQPRDRDERAAYALFDCDAWRVSFRRVSYDREPLLRQNRRVGLLPPGALRRVAARVLGYPRP
jgi:predicted phosphodiesterase